MTPSANRHRRAGARPVASEVVELVAGLMTADRAAPASVDEAITRMTARGMSAAEIARKLDVTPRTVTRRRAGIRAVAEGDRS